MAKYSLTMLDEYMLNKKFIVELAVTFLLIHISTVPLDQSLPPKELTV